MRSELWRKGLHLLSLLIPVGLLFFGTATALKILVPMTITSLALEILRAKSAAVRDRVGRIFGFMMRPEEIPPVPASIRLNGATWVLLTSTIIIALFPPTVAATAIAIGLVGDAAAAVVGRKYGRTRIAKSEKTVEGSFAFVVFTVPLIWLVPGLTLPAGLVGIAAAGVTEAFDLPVNDNFSVPVAAAVAMKLMML